MKKKEDFCRESNHFLKSLGLALCLVSFGGSAIYASSLYAQRTMLSIQMNDRTVEDVFEYIEKTVSLFLCIMVLTLICIGKLIWIFGISL